MFNDKMTQADGCFIALGCGHVRVDTKGRCLDCNLVMPIMKIIHVAPAATMQIVEEVQIDLKN